MIIIIIIIGTSIVVNTTFYVYFVFTLHRLLLYLAYKYFCLNILNWRGRDLGMRWASVSAPLREIKSLFNW